MFKRLSYSLTITLLTAIASFGQTRQGSLKYNFTAIDSIVSSYRQTLGDSSFFIAHQIWFIGSHASYNGKVYYDNPFEILLYYKRNEKYFAKKINNFGVSKIILCDMKKTHKFLDDNFIKMTLEELTIKQDTLIKNDSLIEIRTTTTDHQRADKIWIHYKGKFLTYSFPAEYADNKWNLNKKQYLFLQLLQRQSEIISKNLKTN